MADKWSRNIKLDMEEDKDVIDAAERMGPTLLFRQAVRYYLAREPYAVYPEKAKPRYEDVPNTLTSSPSTKESNEKTTAKFEEF